MTFSLGDGKQAPSSEALRSVGSPRDTLQIMSQRTSPQQNKTLLSVSFEFLPFHRTDGTDRRKKIPRGWTNVCDSEIALLEQQWHEDSPITANVFPFIGMHEKHVGSKGRCGMEGQLL